MKSYQQKRQNYYLKSKTNKRTAKKRETISLSFFIYTYMKYLKRINESNINIENLEEYFLETSDFCDFEIDIIWFESGSRDWANNDFSNKNVHCDKGFCISISHKFYDNLDINEFNEYVKLINQLSEDLDRFKFYFKPNDIFLEIESASTINILIKP